MVDDFNEKSPSTPHRQQVLLIDKMWKLVPKVEARATLKKVWVKKNLGISQPDAESLDVLKNAGSLANPLWDRVESGAMSPHLAKQLLRIARDMGAANDPTVLEAIVRRFDKTKKPNVRFLEELTSSSAVTVVDDAESRSDELSHLWKTVSDTVAAIADIELSGIHNSERVTLMDQLNIGLKGVITELRARVNRVKNQGVKAVKNDKPSKSSVVAACNTLRVKMEKGSIDMLLAKKMKNKLCMEYHPDKDPKADSSLFMSVIDAYDIVERWMESTHE
jgi:hypothetical protein